MKGLRENRPLQVTLAVLAGIIVLTAAVGLVLGAVGGKRFYSDSTAPYPYNWTERRDGSITLNLDGRKVPSGVWEADSAGGILEVSLGETKRGRAAAALSPAGEGRAMLTFTLTDGEDSLAEVSFLMDVVEENGQFTAAVADHRETARQALVSGGAETDYPFTVEPTEAGDLVIHIRDAEIATEEAPLSDGAAEIPAEPEEPDEAEPEEEVEKPEKPEKGEGPEEDPMPWEAYSSDEMIVSVQGVVFTLEGADVLLEGRVSGTAAVTVSKASADLSYVFTFQRSGYSLLLTDSRVQSYTPYVPPEFPEAETLEPEVVETAEAVSSDAEPGAGTAEEPS